MATISKKISATDYKCIGDTQGLMILRDRKPDFSTGWVTVTTEGTLPAGLNPIVHNLNTPNDLLDVDVHFDLNDGEYNTIAVRDGYSPLGYGGLQFSSENVNSIFPVVQVANNVLIYHSVTDGGSYKRVPAGGKVKIDIWKKTERVPYIIANKGALVSGGGFQFDEDGNGYTKNYSQNEIAVGKWINGKTIYSRTIGPFNLPALAPAATYNLSNPIPTGTIDRLTYSELNANGAMLYANVYSFNAANIIIMNTTQMTWVPYNNCYLTAQYTKVE